MDIGIAGNDDLLDLARLLWSHSATDEQATQSPDAFAAALASWWANHSVTHHALVARDAAADIVGMAWLALVPRVPRPGDTNRLSGDIQSVFVAPEHRGQQIGSALIASAVELAVNLGAGRVTVHSSVKAVPVYHRLGFASSTQLLGRDSPQQGPS